MLDGNAAARDFPIRFERIENQLFLILRNVLPGQHVGKLGSGFIKKRRSKLSDKSLSVLVKEIPKVVLCTLFVNSLRHLLGEMRDHFVSIWPGVGEDHREALRSASRLS